MKKIPMVAGTAGIFLLFFSKPRAKRVVKNLNDQRRAVSALIRGLWPQIKHPLWGWSFTPAVPVGLFERKGRLDDAP
jgi:nitrogen-specific signal transduction histidine kinase